MCVLNMYRFKEWSHSQFTYLEQNIPIWNKKSIIRVYIIWIRIKYGWIMDMGWNLNILNAVHLNVNMHICEYFGEIFTLPANANICYTTTTHRTPLSAVSNPTGRVHALTPRVSSRQPRGGNQHFPPVVASATECTLVLRETLSGLPVVCARL